MIYRATSRNKTGIISGRTATNSSPQREPKPSHTPFMSKCVGTFSGRCDTAKTAAIMLMTPIHIEAVLKTLVFFILFSSFSEFRSNACKKFLKHGHIKTVGDSLFNFFRCDKLSFSEYFQVVRDSGV